MSGMGNGGVVREKGKFAVLGFTVSCRLQDVAHADTSWFLDILDAQLESRGFIMGGGVDADCLDIFVLPHKDADVTDSDRLALAEWLDQQPLCTQVAVGDWMDAYSVA